MEEHLLRSRWRFLILLIALATVTALVFFYYHKISVYYQVDFSAYYAAAVSVSRGEDPYANSPEFENGKRFEHSQFLQPPIVAHFFRPFAWLAYHQAKDLWFVGQLLLIMAVIALHVRDPIKTVLVTNGILMAIPLLFWPFYAHFERGQTDLLVLFFIACSKFLWDRGKSTSAGILLAFGAIFKLPTAFIFSVPLAAKDKKFVMGGLISFALLLLLSLSIDGYAINQAYFFEYLPAIGNTGILPVEVYDIEQQQSELRARRYIWDGRKYDGREYAVALGFQAPNGSFTRFLRLESNHAFGTVMGILGVLLTATVIIFFLHRNDSLLSRQVAWLFAMMTVLLFHPLTWLMNYVWLLFISLELFSLSKDFLRQNKPSPKVIFYGIMLGGLLLTGISDRIGTLIRQMVIFTNNLLTSPWQATLLAIVNGFLKYRVWLGGMILWLFLLGLILRGEKWVPAHRLSLSDEEIES